MKLESVLGTLRSLQFPASRFQLVKYGDERLNLDTPTVHDTRRHADGLGDGALVTAITQ
jgi:hypothetical protein